MSMWTLELLCTSRRPDIGFYICALAVVLQSIRCDPVPQGKMAKAMKATKAMKAKWELKPFTTKEKSPWKAAVTSVRKELKVRKRDHPALFMLGAAGKHLYEAVQEQYKKAGSKNWKLKKFSKKESAPWISAVASAQKQLHVKSRVHPALFLLSVVGKELYEAAQDFQTLSAGLYALIYD
ncbi:unnamed protein product [Effrenium voratum]|nr:unnamed protein product [Effrenium voratum]